MESQKKRQGKNLKSLLNDLYYSIESPVSFSGLEKLYNEAKQHDENVKRKDVKDWLSTQLTYTLHRPVKLNFKTRPVIVHDIDEQWQMDLVDLSNLSKYNSGFKYLLVTIDVLSKYAWIEPLKTKTAKELKEAIEKIFSSDGRQPSMIQTDKGTEFLNFQVKNLLKERKIKLFTTNSERKASVVERLNRTMKSIMFKYFTKHNTRKYIDILPDLVQRYNNSYHRSIKMRPVNVNKRNVPIVWINLYDRRLSKNVKNNDKLNVGDYVRISIEKQPFQKRYQEVWTEELFIVTHCIIVKNFTIYKLKDQAGEAIKGSFYFEELQKVTEPDTYRIERVIRKKRDVDGKLIYYVKWKGYSDKFNSYVHAQDLQS